MYELKAVDKKFPGVHALKAIDFHIKRGEIVGLVGENGAGKSTLMKVIYGAYQPDGGHILINGQTVRFANPRQAMEKGIGMVFQEQSLIANLTVMENIFLGYEQQFVRFGVINWKAMATAAKAQLAKVKLDIDPATITSKLSFAQRQLVELAKVLTLEERVDGDLVILLDEPTSVLSKEEVQLLFKLVRELVTRASFIFVSHRMDEVMELSDRIYVMKDGHVVDVVERGAAQTEAIQHKMVGRNVDKEYYREQLQKPFDRSKVLVEMDGVGLPGRTKDISLKLHAGEVLCLVGTEGSGREAILRMIYGMLTPTQGNLQIKGGKVKIFSPRHAVSQGVGYVPRERKIEGIVAGMNVYENMTLSQMNKHSRAGVLRISEERALARDWIKKLSIKAHSEFADCGNLSGGNQQKVVLAKWRSAGSDIMLLDHPTRGLDIGAKEDVYDMIREMSGAGVGIVLVADTLEEAIGLSHTIVVVKDGRIQKNFDCVPGAKPSLFDLLHYMI
ncbi:sugar ABC transporter ATP-binding protein [Ensifer sp. 1H6]|uniref:sugar ABC transporter ATP-binding protein n=1 Tax=Ensifer sp. 1H6 TaxID=1911585 RepID=UPI00042EB910|nr:sugar ABC transporter ATP-binding protein [Ensifer sp. 1H6]AHK47083.1 ribose ABC transporter, ATP-binding protein [Ensifer adhaerens OV14]MDP9633924.1 ribose transport system ATP-binding protein [Ensifer adhaerens]OMQ40149.1 ABC transporter ATP-binding protein [Ensifer sp. 1H6]